MKESMQVPVVSVVAAGLMLALAPAALAQRTVSDDRAADSRSLEQLRAQRFTLTLVRDRLVSGETIFIPPFDDDQSQELISTFDFKNFVLKDYIEGALRLEEIDQIYSEVKSYTNGYAEVLRAAIEELDNRIRELDPVGSDPASRISGVWRVQVEWDDPTNPFADTSGIVTEDGTFEIYDLRYNQDYYRYNFQRRVLLGLSFLSLGFEGSVSNCVFGVLWPQFHRQLWSNRHLLVHRHLLAGDHGDFW